MKRSKVQSMNHAMKRKSRLEPGRSTTARHSVSAARTRDGEDSVGDGEHPRVGRRVVVVEQVGPTTGLSHRSRNTQCGWKGRLMKPAKTRRPRAR